MRKLFSILLILSIHINLDGQRISSGINIHTPIGSDIRFNQDFYQLTNTFMVYTVNPLNENNKKFYYSSPFGLGFKHYKVFGLGVGYFLKTDFRKWTFRSGIQISYRSTGIKLYEPQTSIYSDPNQALFTMHSLQYSIPLHISYSFKKSVISPFLLFGLDRSQLTFVYEKIDDLSFERYHVPFFYNHYYNEKSSYNLILGYGKKNKTVEWYISYSKRIDKNIKELSIQYSIINFNVNLFLNYKSYSKNHFIYSNE